MKKTIALVLSASMLLACAGCTEKETTKKKKKPTTKKTKVEDTDPTDDPTEDPTEDPTDDPTEPTDDPVPTDTEPTDTVTATTPAPRGDGEYLEALSVGNEITYMEYGAQNPAEEGDYNPFLMYTMYYTDFINIMDDEGIPQELGSKLLSVEEEFSGKAKKEYEEAVALFAKYEKEGSELFRFMRRSISTVYRADEQVLSFVESQARISENESQGDESREYVDIPHNYRTEDGSEITLDDIVTDKTSLIYYLEDIFEDDYNLEDTIDAINDGSVAFAILYDGIYFPDLGKVPYYGQESIMNDEFFQKTTDYFTLILDGNRELVWDFDGDGYKDGLYVSATFDDYYMSELKISINGESTAFTSADLPDLGNATEISQWNDQYAMYTADGWYLVLTLYDFDLFPHIYIMKMNGTTVTPVMDMEAEFKSAYDPYQLQFYRNTYFMGQISVCGYYALNGGMLMPYSIFEYAYSGVYETTVDFTGKEVDMTTFTPGADKTIPSGSKVSVIAYAEGSGDVILKVLDPDESKTYYVSLVVTDDGRISGQYPSQSFIGLFWGE